jgi:hypothetical protein
MVLAAASAAAAPDRRLPLGVEAQSGGVEGDAKLNVSRRRRRTCLSIRSA